MKIPHVTIDIPSHGSELCQTPCPFYPWKKVGSMICAECEFYCKKESTKTEVKCKKSVITKS